MNNETPEIGERQRDDPPRIYVASLADYNSGHLHGTWLDLDNGPEAMWDGIHSMLAGSREPIAEEWAIHDYEGFGPLHLGEYEDLNQVARLAAGIVEHGPAFAHWAAQLDRAEWEEELDHFEDRYHGCWSSMEEFAEQLLDDLGVDLGARGPEELQPYIHFDVEAFARDLSFDYRISRGDEGVYVFE